jgi:hypothetical protein
MKGGKLGCRPQQLPSSRGNILEADSRLAQRGVQYWASARGAGRFQKVIGTQFFST